MVDDDGSGTTGTVINNAWKTELYNQIDAALPGLAPWATAPADNTWFGVGAGAGNWSVTVQQYRYALVGKTLTIAVKVTGQTFAAGGTLNILLPASNVAKGAHIGAAFYSAGTGVVAEIGVSVIGAGEQWVSIYRPGALQFPAATWSYFYVQLTLEVQ